MLVKKFEAENMAAALKLVKASLGPEALVLSTRTRPKKGLGVLGRQVVEVTAAIESPATKGPSRAVTTAMMESSLKPAKRMPTAYSERVETLDDERVSLSSTTPRRPRKIELAEHPLEDEVRALRAQLEAQNISGLQQEMNELKDLVRGFCQPSTAPSAATLSVDANDHDGLSSSVPTALTQNQSVRLVPPTELSRYRGPVEHSLADLVEILTERGIDPEGAATIARFAASRMTERQRCEPNLCQEFLSSTIADLVQTSGPLWSPGQPQKRMSLIGATGVGKTTTIAKLAAAAMTDSGARVALVTIDTYRIAAVEQLKIYADIMGLPVEVVLSPDQLQEAFRRHQDKDLILIDTAGRSPRDEVQIAQLKEFLGQGAGVENHLVLAAPTAERLQQQALDAFAEMPLAGLIFTKLDETDYCGSLINLPLKSNLPLAYLTNGQKVPEDLLPAEPRLVADLVMTEHEQLRRFAV